MCTMITLLAMRLFFVCCTIFSVQCINVDDKLDFDNSPTFTGNSRYTNKANFVPIKVTKTVSSVKPGDNFENIGVVCVTGGCNKTVSSEETIKTDVFVHIETKVDLKKNESSSNEPPEDISDVPVVVGFAGAKLDPTPGDDITQKVFTDSVTNRGRSFTPNYIPKTDIFESEVENTRRNGYNITNYGKIYSFGTPDRTANTPSFAPLSARNGISYGKSIQTYPTNPKTVTNINIAGVSAQEDNIENLLNTKYKTNHTPLTVPYFEPSYHNHYYGENPPPQFVWYPKNMNVPFKVTTPGRSESVWFKNNAHRHVASTTGSAGNGHEVKCFCQRDNGDVKIRNGLSWYPSIKRTFNNDPGSQINDKLAPLN